MEVQYKQLDGTYGTMVANVIGSDINNDSGLATLYGYSKDDVDFVTKFATNVVEFCYINVD